MDLKNKKTVSIEDENTDEIQVDVTVKFSFQGMKKIKDAVEELEWVCQMGFDGWAEYCLDDGGYAVVEVLQAVVGSLPFETVKDILIGSDLVAYTGYTDTDFKDKIKYMLTMTEFGI